MKRHAPLHLPLLATAAGIVLAASCNMGGSGGNGGTPGISGHLKVVQGATGASAFAPGGFAPADGRWYLSPDRATITLTDLTLVAPDTAFAAPLTDCTPTYDRSQATGTQLLDCPFELPAGTYTGITIGILTTSQILINDPVNGIYTSPSVSGGLTVSSAGGVDFVNFTPVGPGGGNIFTTGAYYLGPGQVVKFGTGAGESTDIYVAVDMIHTVYANIAGGVATLETQLPIPPALLTPSVGSPAREAFYTSTGTADNAFGCVDVPNPCTNDDNESVRISYPPGSDQPYMLFGPQFGQVAPVDPATSEVFPDGCKRGGYLGFDGAKLCWAMPQDCQFNTYSKVCSMALSSSLGSTVTIECQNMTTAPPPVSGETYASGCPTLVPDYTQTLTFVAE